MKKTFLLAGCALLFTASIFIGCASIMGGGTKQNVQISSTPAAATVKVERSGVVGRTEVVWEGTTPATVNLQRKFEYLVTISLDNYKPLEVPLEHGTNGWVWGNLICGGIIGLIVDFSNGAAKKLKPGEISVQLVSVQGGASLDATIYAVLSTYDSNGDLRTLPVPLVPDHDSFVTNR